MKQKRDLVLMLCIGVLIGTLVVVVWNWDGSGNRAENDASTYSGLNKENTTPGAPSSDNISSPSIAFPLPPSIPANTRVGLSVLDQSRGKTVFVENLSIVGTKWIAIYDEQDGKPGWILGAARAHEGDKNATVELLRQEGTISGATYYAAILNDDGDGSFNRLTDLPPLSPDKVTVVRFRAR